MLQGEPLGRQWWGPWIGGSSVLFFLPATVALHYRGGCFRHEEGFMFDITIKGIPKVESGFLGPAWREIGERVLEEVRSNFAREGAKVGGWAPLSKVTALLREVPPLLISNPYDLFVKWALCKPLVETGELWESFFAGSPGNVFEVEDDQVTVGSSLEKAEFHQKGGSKVFVFDESKLAARFTDDDSSYRYKRGKLQFKLASFSSGSNSRPYYLYWLKKLHLKHGRTTFVPARPILFPMNYLEPELRDILERGVETIVSQSTDETITP